jgi:DNA-binding NarL/FixJ family response regulator
MSQRRILLADDHAPHPSWCAGQPRQQPDLTVVAEASDGAEAVALTKTNDIDLAILDVAMPRMTEV